jgi:hypothetical protein
MPNFNPYDPRYPISPPANKREFPRNAYFPDDYGRVSPLQERRPMPQRQSSAGVYPEYYEEQMDQYGPAHYDVGGAGNRHYPRGNGRKRGGFWHGGDVGEWEVWR